MRPGLREYLDGMQLDRIYKILKIIGETTIRNWRGAFWGSFGRYVEGQDLPWNRLNSWTGST